jgi:hypothetical protein
LCLTLIALTAGDASAQAATGGDVLSETPILPVPAQMTLEEYTDANRRLSVGLVLMSVPLPGSLHFYAGESRQGWLHVGAAALGAVSIVVGAATIDEKDTWESSDYEVVDVTGQSGEVQRYAKVPIEEEGGVFTYRLRKLDHKTEGAGGVLVLAGVGLIAGQLLHDWIDGIRTIERKRNAVRYKYGKLAELGVSLRPSTDLQKRRIGAEVALRF